MSESRTHAEIEDVLSSIRRLVSQDGVAPRRTGLFRTADSSPRLAEPAAAAAETLVLTPALRVAHTAPTNEPVAAPPSPVAETSLQPEPRNGEDVALPEPALAANAHDAANANEAVSRADTAEAVLVDAQTEEFPDSGLTIASDWQLPEAETKPENLNDELSRLESTIAELEAAVAASDERFEPEHGDDFSYAAPRDALTAAFVQPFPDEIADDTPEEPALAEAAEPEEPPRATEAEAAPREPEFAPHSNAFEPEDRLFDAVEWVDPLDPAEAELTAADWAEEDLEEEPAAKSAPPRRLHLADAQPATHSAKPPLSSYDQMRLDAESELSEAEEASLFAATADMMIDEAALRAMVSEIIRQELQGTLGERITRSVRKLVRREIGRAIASRDFD
ncbi:hypothetical protein [Phaeovulum sp.]|uniref:hypothetical protein n=1 Tax=Phaeovulum sp. TaxID=2934796 RepID=UPI00356182E9